MNNINANVENCFNSFNSLDAYIAVLKGESAKLSDMIAKLNDKIQEVETKKEQLIKEQNEPKFETTQDEKYYFVDFCSRGCNLNVTSDVYKDVMGDKLRVDQNNCFKTKERAEEVANKIKFLLKLERLHDIYCPDYKPDDWEINSLKKYYVCYSPSRPSGEKWRLLITRNIKDAVQVYFPTREIAQKVCDILNSEE